MNPHTDLTTHYLYAFIEAHALLSSQQQHHHAHQQQQQHQQYHARQQHIRQQQLLALSQNIATQQHHFNTNARIDQLICMSESQEIFQESNEPANSVRRYPRIVLPDLEWALVYLQEVQYESLAEMEPFIGEKRQKVVNLTSNLKKYEERLKKIQQNVEKKMLEMQNRKRFL